MKKLLFTTLVGILFSSNIIAQTQKGNVIWGTNVSNLQLDFGENSTQFGINITPKIGYFISDGFAVGPELNIGYQSSDGSDIFNYGLGAFGRYYLVPGSVDNVRSSRYFIEANAGISGVNTGGDNTNGLGLGFGPGIAYFITPNVALEGLLKYNFTAGFGNSTTSNRLGLGIGFQIYLPGKTLRNKVKNP